jgi:hypothetical protein
MVSREVFTMHDLLINSFTVGIVYPAIVIYLIIWGTKKIRKHIENIVVDTINSKQNDLKEWIVGIMKEESKK